MFASVTDSTARRRDQAMIALAIGLAMAGLAVGGGPGKVALALVAAGLPVAAFVAIGHVPGRGAAAACLAAGLAVAIGRPGPLPAAMPSATAIAAVAGIALAAGFGTVAARRMRAADPAVAKAGGGRWVSIVVESGGPSGMAGRPVRPRVAPRADPERRSLARMARGRRTEPASRRGAVVGPVGFDPPGRVR